MLAFALPALLLHAQIPAVPALQIRVDLSEAEAALSILDLHREGRTIPEEAWQRLFATEGYRRLKTREEAAYKHPFEDADFRAFVLSEDLLQRGPALRQTLDAWKRLDPRAAGAKALAYLPAGSRIRATVFPVIKPRTNSFVWEMKTDPAIFFYLDPKATGPQIENTFIHELHHIGFGTTSKPAPAKGSEALENARLWTGAFSEGFAMLAAAGGPEIHPHAVSPAEDRTRWDRDVAHFEADFHTLEAFFMDILVGRLKGEPLAEKAFTFYGEQGPWYTVGWLMAATIERRLGRTRLLAVYQDPVGLYRAWNEAAVLEEKAAKTPLPRWPEALVKGVESR